MDIEAQFTLNQSRAEEITMREDYGNITLVPHDDGFGDMGTFDTDHTDLIRSPHSLEPSLDQVCHDLLHQIFFRSHIHVGNKILPVFLICCEFVSG